MLFDGRTILGCLIVGNIGLSLREIRVVSVTQKTHFLGRGEWMVMHWRSSERKLARAQWALGGGGDRDRVDGVVMIRIAAIGTDG